MRSSVGRSLVASVLTVAAAMLVLASGANAADTHDYLLQFSEVPSSSGAAVPGPITQADAMTVDSGHVWLAEHVSGSGAYRLDEFDASSGAFISQPAHTETREYVSVAVGHALGEGQILLGEYSNQESASVVEVLSESGSHLATWTGAATPAKSFGYGGWNVAADNSEDPTDPAVGDVYVADSGQQVVDVFKPQPSGGEQYVTQITGRSPTEPFAYLQAVAVDQANGDVVVIDNGVVEVFEPTLLGQYTFVRDLTPPGALSFYPSQVDASDGEGDTYVLGAVLENGEYMGNQALEFGPGGEYVGRVTPPASSYGSAQSVAADPVTHDVFIGFYFSGNVASEHGYVDVFGPNVVIPDVTTGAVTEATVSGEGTIEATLTGTVNPDGAGAASCDFAWGTSTVLGETVPCSAVVANGESPDPVGAPITGLKPDTTYEYRLQATNANGTNPGEPWQDQAFTTPGPGLHGAAVSSARAESVTFEATINPHNAPTTSYFQYGPAPCTSGPSGCTDVPTAPGVAVGAGEGDVEVTQHVQGLQPGTTYHYRLVVVSEITAGQFESFYGPDQTFTTQTVGVPFALPDHRAWEMVSPAQKEGAALGYIVEGIVQGAADGNAISDWTLFEPIEEKAAGAYGFTTADFFGRSPDGWHSKTITPPHSATGFPPVGNGQEYRMFSEDLSKAILQPFGALTPLAPGVSEATPYVRTDYLNGDPGEICAKQTEEVNGIYCYEPLATAANTLAGAKFGEEPEGKCERIFCGPVVIGANPDLSHIVLRSGVQLTSASEGPYGLYEWSGGKLQMISWLPEDERNEKGGQAAIGAALGTRDAAARHAISNDGSRVFFAAQTQGFGAARLYMRDTAKGETVRLNLPQGPNVPEIGREQQGATFRTASADGSRAFFTANEPLIEGAKLGDLYEYNLNKPLGSRLSDLTIDTNGRESANVTAVQGAAEDGSYVYFTATGVLAPGATPGVCGGNGPSESDTNVCNLYMSHDGVITFIAGLSQGDYPDWADPSLDHLTARVSPNGEWLAFMSKRDLTGYDTTDAVSGRPDEEVYLYNGRTNMLVCASCNPTGARPVGVQYNSNDQIVAADRIFNEGEWIASNVPPWTRFDLSETRYQSRYLASSGRLFFDSHDALLPQDVNGTQDVYEWEPAGVGSCTATSTEFSARSGGCVSLISSGTSNEESAFLDASETGGDVFFLTAAKLVPQDFDNANDIYDARECVPQSRCILPPPAAPPACSNEASCRPAPAVQPSIFGTPASGTFKGTGNVTPPAEKTPPKSRRCSRGHVRRHGRCVAHRKRRAKKHKRIRRSARRRK